MIKNLHPRFLKGHNSKTHQFLQTVYLKFKKSISQSMHRNNEILDLK